jgi:hypothetical protein
MVKAAGKENYLCLYKSSALIQNVQSISVIIDQ